MEGIMAARLVKFTALFMILCVLGSGASAAVHSSGCAVQCVCYVDQVSGFKTANCTGVKFISENKFDIKLNETEVINFELNSDGDPIKLRDDMFTSFPKLKILNLSNCKISNLPKNVFRGLKKILEINLSSNEIKHIDSSVFENLYTLNRLNLRGNPLQIFNKFFISSRSLRELDIGYCRLTSLQNDFFHGLKRLTRLYVDGNHLQTVKEHVLPHELTHLNLANNRIINVPVGAIYSLSKLRRLDLSANPINCTCPLLTLQDMLSRKGIIIDGEVRCAYPPELENISWSKINENEFCDKETFNSRHHFSKSQTSKFMYQKKDKYFENEKFNLYDSIQADDPGTSAEDYNYDEPRESLKTDTKNEEKQEGDKESDSTAKYTEGSGNQNSHNSSIQTGNKESEPENLVQDKENHQDLQKESVSGAGDITSLVEDKIIDKEAAGPLSVGGSADIDDNKINEIEESKVPPENTDKVEGVEHKSETDNDPVLEGSNNEDDDPDKELPKIGNEQTEEETTPFPPQEDLLFNVTDDDIEKSGPHIFDENMEKVDQVIPVKALPEKDKQETDAKEDGKKNSNGELSEGNITKESGKEVESSNGNLENRTNLVELTKGLDDNVNTGLNEEGAEKDQHEEKQEKNDSNGGVKDEIEGSGVEPEENIGENNYPLENEDIVEETKTNDPVQSTTDFIPDSKLPKQVYKDVDEEVIDKSSADSDVLGQVVDKKPLPYETMGPYIVVICIIIFIAILVMVSIYKGFCKPKKTNRKQTVRDVEANNGTELQDMTKSLLPNAPVNDDKHNNKYPNEIPSPETVNLIKAEKTDDTHEPDGTHDHANQNGKSDPPMKNGKSLEPTSPPIEKTKARLTVLLESIPRTPIFVQKLSTSLNNGNS